MNDLFIDFEKRLKDIEEKLEKQGRLNSIVIEELHLNDQSKSRKVE